MEQTIQSLDICGFLKTHLTEVFETMLSLKVQPVAGDGPPSFSERVTGSVGLGGEKVNGAIYLHLSTAFSQRVTGLMLGCGPEEVGEAEMNDVIGELTNMLAGGLKSALCDHGAPCAVSTPAIIRGTSFEIETVPEVHRDLILFGCEADRIAVEVHIKIIP